MNTITLLQPRRVVIGNGCAARCAGFLAEAGARRVLLVTSKSTRPQIESLVQALKDSGCEVAATQLVPAEPGLKFFEAALAQAQGARIDSVLGVGGGSALDVAKLIAALAHGPQRIHEVFGINLLLVRQLSLVCLPTTSGTGSEVSPNAILLDEAAELKKAVISPHLVPDAAFIDPLLSLSVPPDVTAATGLDALTHCIEAYANRFSHPVADVYALEGIRLICAHLARAVRDGRDAEARAAMALGSYYGGLCLGPVNTGAVHALSYPLGGRFHIGHGVANAVLLPAVLRFNLSSAAGRYADIAAAAGVARNGSDAEAAARGIDFFSGLSRQCGVPQSLSALRIPREAIPGLAASAMQVQRLLKNNPRPLSEGDAVGLYESIY